MKKNLYMVQVNASFEGSVYLPYAAGALLAYAMSNDEVNENYDFKEIIYMRKNIDEVIKEIESPAVMAFSNYIWNFEYNKALAAKIKELYPECVIVFGGHNVPAGSKLLDELPFTDYLIFGEGEEPFCRLLLSLCGKAEFDSVPNIAYRTDGGAVCTQSAVFTDIDYPSPYETGVFDSIVKKSPFGVSAILETNRGCPYHCAFCDWGKLHSKIRQFPMRRVLSDIQWMADNKIEYCYCADSNFGIFPRDDEIIDFVIAKHSECGYPQKFRVNYLKNSDEKVFEINRKLYENGMSKGVTLSFQSMSERTLEIIGRKNITMNRFRELLVKYQKAGLAAYSELIMGLPGETYESFCEGLERLLEAGQHSSIFIYNCELLVNSKLGSPEFKEKYQLRTAHIPFNQDHFAPVQTDVQEYSNIIVSTSTMPREQWVRTASTSVFIQAFHCLGLMQCISMFLYYNSGIPYMDFYRAFMNYLLNKKDSLSEVWANAVKHIESYSKGECNWLIFNEKYGNISWPVEEAVFLDFVSDSGRFYERVKAFLEDYIEDEHLRNELVEYQKFILKKPTDTNDPAEFDYDFYNYFSKLYIGESAVPEKKRVAYRKKQSAYNGVKDYAKTVVWFGRRNDKMITTDLEEIG
ncbi:MAG: radical SAM protein [Clostridia bacterium]|nr:radical SAM protein [Clostridia bacterium]